MVATNIVRHSLQGLSRRMLAELAFFSWEDECIDSSSERHSAYSCRESLGNNVHSTSIKTPERGAPSLRSSFSTGNRRSSVRSDSPGVVIPLRALWARDFMDERKDSAGQDKSLRYLSTLKGAFSATPSIYTDGFNSPSLAGLQTSQGPPPRWGLGVPWPWRAGMGQVGMQKQVEVDPVQLFAQLSDTCEVSRLSIQGEKAMKDLAPSVDEKSIIYDDFIRFGKEMLQVEDGPDLEELWACLCEANSDASTVSEPRRSESEVRRSHTELLDDGDIRVDTRRECSIQLEVFRAWYENLCSTLDPGPSWRSRLKLQSQELLVRKTPVPSVRMAFAAIPAFLALTSERLLLGTMNFATLVALDAISSLEAREGILGESLFVLTIEDAASSKVPTAAFAATRDRRSGNSKLRAGEREIILRFGRSESSRCERDSWLSSVKELAGAYALSWAAGNTLYIARAAHSVACSAALPPRQQRQLASTPCSSRIENSPSAARLGGSLIDRSDSVQLMRLSGITSGALRISCIAGDGTYLALATVDATINLYQVVSDFGNPIDNLFDIGLSESPQRLFSSLPTMPYPVRDLNGRTLHEDREPLDGHASPEASASVRLKVHTKTLIRLPCPDSVAVTSMQFASSDKDKLGTKQTLSMPPPLLTLSGGILRLWSPMLKSDSLVPLPQNHKAHLFAVQPPDSRNNGMDLERLAVVSEPDCPYQSQILSIFESHKIDECAGHDDKRSTMKFEYKLKRELVLPVRARSIEWCGHYICVVHSSEYVLVSTKSGSVQELFSFVPDYGLPCVAPMSRHEVLLVCPPESYGERHVGVFVDSKGCVTTRSTVDWRVPPVKCVRWGERLVCLEAHRVEVLNLQNGTSQQLPCLEQYPCALANSPFSLVPILFSS